MGALVRKAITPLAMILMLSLTLAFPSLGSSRVASDLRCEDLFATTPPRTREPASVDSDEPAATVVGLNPKVPVERLRSPHIKVIKLDEIQPIDPWTMPDPMLRDRLFDSSGVSAFVRDWDHLRRDLLFLRAQWMTDAKLETSYPGIGKPNLRRLSLVIRTERAREKTTKILPANKKVDGESQ